MLTRNPFLIAGASALSLMLAACGGGGGDVVASIPPPPTPTPTPTPTPAGSPIIFPGVTASTNFATLGYEQRNSAGALTSDGFSARYDASSKQYVFDFPASDPGPLDVYQTGDRYWNAVLGGQPAGSPQIYVNAFRPGAQNFDFALTYTSFAEYTDNSGLSGVVAFGLPTPTSAIPVTGSATYKAFVAATADVGYGISGSASLQFNFGQGTLAGQFDPVIYDLLAGNTPLGHYDFINTVYATGSSVFSGQLSSANVSGLGSFEGQFTGPGAEELMARFRAPFIDPYSKTQRNMFGVWVGSK
jgi:hypothetical protein